MSANFEIVGSVGTSSPDHWNLPHVVSRTGDLRPSEVRSVV
jgi:hypothetical protein